MSQKLEYFVIHCTATPVGRIVTRQDIIDWHTKPKPEGRGWSRVGYSDMIHLNGHLQNLQEYNNDDQVDSWEITNGVRGENSVSRHVVYVGGISNGKPADTRTTQQYDTLKALTRVMVARYPDIKIAGHNQLAAKACPCFNVSRFCRMIGIPERNIYKVENT